MKRTITWTTFTLLVLVAAFLNFSPSSASFVTSFDVDRTDDVAGASACTVAPNDCSLRGAILATNADLNADPVIINLAAATTYHLTLTNATQENAAATGDLDITTTLHSVTIVGGGSSGPNASIIEASALNAGSTRDRAFHITTSGITAIFQDLVIQNGKAADDGTSGKNTNPASQNSPGTGGGILNNGGNLTLTNVTLQSCEAIGKGDSIVNEHTTLEARGGGLASFAGTGNVMISGSRFTANNATGGNGGNFNNSFNYQMNVNGESVEFGDDNESYGTDVVARYAADFIRRLEHTTRIRFSDYAWIVSCNFIRVFEMDRSR